MMLLRRLLATLFALLVALALWSVLEPRFYDVRREHAAIPGLPEAWDGERIALVSDFQIGLALGNDGTVREVVERIIRERPAVTLLAGDFVYHAGDDPATLVERVTELVRPLTAAGLPTYAVLGNHDYGMKHDDGTPDEVLARRVALSLEQLGIPVLENETVALPAPNGSGEMLYLVGLGASWPENVDADAALDGVPAGSPTVVLMHNPNAFTELPPYSAPLALAGHTHGGQVRLPHTPEWTWMTFARTDTIHADGWISGYGAPGNRLYVTRGIGMSVLPVRLNCMPELTIIELVRLGPTAASRRSR